MGKKTLLVVSPKISLTLSLTKCQPDTKPHLWGTRLTTGQPDLSSNTLGYKMSLLGGTSDQRSA